MKVDGGVMKMRELTNGLEIPPGGNDRAQARLLACHDDRCHQAFVKGERVKASLTFEKAARSTSNSPSRGGGDARQHQH